MSLMSTNASVRKASARKREEDDFYRTNAATTRALLDVESFPRVVVEPSCGDGAISRVFTSQGFVVISSDLIERGFAPGGLDFLKEKYRPADALVTNPPFTLIDDFALHALALGYQKIALLGRLAWLEGGRRFKKLWLPHPPIRVWVFSDRQTLWRGDDAQMEAPKGGAIPFAWFIFEQGNTEPPRLDWLQTR